MAKQTLLTMVQSVLDAIGENPVNDINDTSASRKVVKIIREVYDQEAVFGDWAHLRYLGQLTGLGDTAKRTVLRIPDNVDYVEELRYKYLDDNGDVKSPVITKIEDPREFLDIVLSRRSTATNITAVEVPSDETVTILAYNDRQPKYWTTFDDEYIILDAYDATVESTLQGVNTYVVGKRETPWTDDKDFIPDMPTEKFPFVLAQAVTVAAERLTDTVAASDRAAASRGRAYIRYKGGKTDGSQPRKKRFGRK